MEKALIKVENIYGSIFLLSAKSDEQWPSTEMSDAVVDRLDRKQFPYPYKHIAIDGGHTEVFDHFDNVWPSSGRIFQRISCRITTGPAIKTA